MLQTTTYENIISLIKEDRIRNAFTYYKDNYKKLSFLKFNDEAVFAFTKNKNDVYEGQAFFLEIENINKVFLSLKEYLGARFIPYILNKNRKEVFEKIAEKTFHLKMYQYVLKTKLEEKLPAYEVFDAKPEENLQDFYIDCFKEEFDENALIWLRDFEQMAQHLEKASKCLKINDELAASIMFWIQEQSIFIFLLGTHPNFRRRKLAYALIQYVQSKFPQKALALTTWAGGNTEKFYLSIGFEKLQMVNACY